MEMLKHGRRLEKNPKPSGNENVPRPSYTQCDGGTMATMALDRSPVFYARVGGFIYLFAMALGIYSQSIVLGGIIVLSDDAAVTARNILASAGLFRLSITADVITSVSDVVIGWAFYQLLKSVDTSLALLGAFLRVADAAI